MSASADRFDEVRRRWIARHQHTFIFQKRRAQVLARLIRDRATENTGARVDPADDDVIHPLPARPVTTLYATIDLVIVAVCAVLAPIGWPAGRVIYGFVTQLIPGSLRSYPVAALLWSTVVVGSPLPLLYQPTDTPAGTVLLPWVLAQVPAALLTAGLYGIVEGWLAVDGARDWWPMRSPHEAERADFGWKRSDLAARPVFGSVDGIEPGERTPIRRDGS